MTTLPDTRDLLAYCHDLGRRARQAERLLRGCTGAQKDGWLRACAAALEARQDEILAANARDLAQAEAHGLTGAQLDRLRLTPARLASMAVSLREVALLPDP